MGAGTIVGYVGFFMTLLLLIPTHPGFILLFLFAIIVVLAYNIKKRKKQKISLGRTPPKNYAKQVNDPDDEYRKKRDTSRAKMGFSPLNEETKKDKSAISIQNDKKNYARIISGDKQIDKKIDEINSNEMLTENIKLDSIQNAFKKNYKEIIEKKSFNKNYWHFGNHESIYSKNMKFQAAIKLCEKNDLGSKAKIRRLRMKMKRWNVENERDMEALMPDYDYLLSLIEEFETK